MAAFVDENSHILSNEVPSLVLSLDKEKVVSSLLDKEDKTNENIIVRSIFDTPTNTINDDNKVNNNDISSEDDITPIINDNDNEDTNNDNENDNNNDVEKEGEPEQEETLQEKERRELEESERLAWELMQQEEQHYYQQQVEYMRQNSETMSAEDLAAIQQIVNEPAIRFQQNNGEDGEENEEDGEEGDEEEENWDYDQLIALGQAIGDVKTERWRLRSKNVIAGLTVIDYDEILRNSSSNIVSVNNCTDSCDGKDQSSGDQSFKKIRIDHSCTVCMDNFEKTDKLNLLPCSHYFHMTCLQGWLSDHNSCPVCKRKVTSSP